MRVAEARLAVARAARDNAALQLSYTTIAAPVSGTVSRKQVEVGQLVQPGQTLMSIVSDSGMFVTANFKETQLARIRVGQRVTLEVDAYGAAAEGEITSIASATGAKFSFAAARQRDRQLHEGGAAHSGAYSHHEDARHRSSAAAGDVGGGQRACRWECA